MMILSVRAARALTLLSIIRLAFSAAVGVSAAPGLARVVSSCTEDNAVALTFVHLLSSLG